MRAHRSLHRFDPDRPFRPWLLRIVANSAKNEIRSSARHLRLTERARRGLVELEPPTDPAVLDDRRRVLVTAINTLSLDDRMIICLRWFDDLSEVEIADVLDVRRGTVKSRLSRAMGRLRDALESPEDHDDRP